MNKLKLLLSSLTLLLLLSGSAWADVVEDFEDGNADNWHIISGNWEVVESTQADGTAGNVLKQTANDPNWIYNAQIIYTCGDDWTSYWNDYHSGADVNWTVKYPFLANLDDWADYTLEADVRMDSGGDFWMSWYASPAGANYAQWFRGRIRNTWSGGTMRYSNWPWQYGQWYHLKAVLDGSTQKFYIDDALVFEQNVAQYTTSGTVNFRTRASYMTFDNFVVTGVPGCAIPVEIDIKPGSDPNSINMNSNGVIPVAILTTDDFDAADVNADTVKFGPAEAAPAHGGHLEDADGDGDIDLVLHFNTQEAGIVAADTEATLTGKTTDGQEIEGSDSVRPLDKGGKKK